MITLSALLKRLINACIFWGSWRERGWTPPSPVLSTGVWWRESTMTAWITVWPCSCTIEKRSRHRSERLRLHAGLLDVPSHWDIYTSRCNDRATSITRHPTHGLFFALPSSWRLRSIWGEIHQSEDEFFQMIWVWWTVPNCHTSEYTVYILHFELTYWLSHYYLIGHLFI